MSHDQDAAIRIYLHSVEVAHSTHTMNLLVSYFRTLALRWTRDVSTKLVYYLTLLRSHQHTLSGHVLGVPLRHLMTPCTVMAKQNYPKRGPWIHITWAHKVIATY